MDAVATAKLTLEKSQFENGLKAAEGAVEHFAKETAGILAGAFAFEKILEGFTGAIEKGEKFADLGNRFGVSASALQEVGNAATLTGASIDDVGAAMNKLAVNAGKALGGDTDMQAKFEDIGLSVEKLRGMSPEDLFYALSDAVSKANDPLEGFAKAQAVAGRGVGSLMELLRSGPDAIKEMGDSMGVWADDEINQLKAAGDAIKEFQNTQTIWFGKTIIGVQGLIERYQDLIEAIYLHIRANRDENLDAAGRASLYEQSAGKTADVVMGRSSVQKTSKEGHEAMDKEGEAASVSKKTQKEFEKSEKEAADQELKLIEAKIKGEEEAQKLAQKFEEEAAKKKEKAIQDAADDEAKYQEELFKAEMEAARFESTEKIRLMRLPRQTQQAEGGAAGQRLDIAAGLGGGVAAEVAKARAKADSDQKKISAQQLDQQILANTSGTTDKGIQRTMASRRSEYIQAQATKEAQGKTTLDDINKTLQDALAKLTSAPLVS
jgi:hypothetical protein